MSSDCPCLLCTVLCILLRHADELQQERNNHQRMKELAECNVVRFLFPPYLTCFSKIVI